MVKTQRPNNKHRSQALLEALKQLLATGKIGTQEEIKQALHQQGFAINQSKVSRLLHKIGAIKTVNEHKHVIYLLPREPAPLSTRSSLAQLIINIEANENLIVLRSNPGSASLIGRLLDHHQQELNILGTVAGDDTIFVAPKSTKSMQKNLQLVKEFLLNIGKV